MLIMMYVHIYKYVIQKYWTDRDIGQAGVTEQMLNNDIRLLTNPKPRLLPILPLTKEPNIWLTWYMMFLSRK
jgi:hypothetical protein